MLSIPPKGPMSPRCQALSRNQPVSKEQENNPLRIRGRDLDIYLPLSRLRSKNECRETIPAIDRETKEKTMNIKLNALCLGAVLALTPFLARPVLADEWNKKTEFQFSEAVQIPGKVLAPGKYIFQLVGNESDRNLVQVLSED